MDDSAKKMFVPEPEVECKPEAEPMEDRRSREEDQARRAARHLRRVCQFQMVEMVVDDFCFDQVFCVTDGIMLKYMQTASDQEDAFSRAHSLLPTEQVRVALCMVAE